MPAAICHQQSCRLPICLFTGLLLVSLVAAATLAAWQPPAESTPFESPVRPRSPVRGLANPRQLLDLFGIDESHLRFLIDGEAVLPEDVDVVSKILMRFHDLGHENIQRWLSSPVPWDEMMDQVEQHRIGFFLVEGVAQRVERQEIVSEAAELYGFDHFFWVTMRGPGDQPVRVATRTIPSSWPIDSPLSEPVAARAMYLKHGPQQDGTTEFYLFAAGRIEWYPRTRSESLAVSEGLVGLSQMGMDVSLFDDVRQRNRRSLGAQERDCFYRLLELLGQQTRAAVKIKPRPINLTMLLRSPQAHHGDFLKVQGTVRRITKIEIPDKAIQARFGIRHYYQLDMFMPLGDQTIQIKLNADDEHGLKFTNQFPLAVCVHQLPAQLATAQRQFEQGTYAGAMLNETVDITGFFYKIWGYQSSFAKTDGTPRRQLSPMILAFTPEMVETGGQRDGVLEIVLALGFAAGLLITWLLVWRSGRGNEQVLRRRRENEPVTTAEQFREMAGWQEEIEMFSDEDEEILDRIWKKVNDSDDSPEPT